MREIIAKALCGKGAGEGYWDAFPDDRQFYLDDADAIIAALMPILDEKSGTWLEDCVDTFTSGEPRIKRPFSDYLKEKEEVSIQKKEAKHE